MKLTDILVTPLSRIDTTDGDVLHAMKQKDAGYDGFGEAYFSWVFAGAIKVKSGQITSSLLPISKATRAK